MKRSMTNSVIWLFYLAITVFIGIVSINNGVEGAEDLITTTNDVVLAQKSWILYHKINGSYTVRAKITLSVPTDSSSSTSTAATTKVISSSSSKSPKDPLRLEYTNIVPTEQDNTIVAEDIAKSILSTPFYQLKLVESTNNNNIDTIYTINDDNDANDDGIIASVPSCNVRRSNYRDEIVLHLGQNGNVLSIQYIPKISPLAPTTCTKYDTVLPHNFYSTATTTTTTNNKTTTTSDGTVTTDTYTHLFSSTTIRYEVTNIGMMLRTVLTGLKAPPGLQRIPGSSSHRGTVNTGSGNSGGNGGGGGIFDDDKNKDNNNNEQQTPPGMFSFLRKYWYIFGPLFIMNMVMGANQQDDSSQQGQQVQGQQQGGVQSPSQVRSGSSTGPAAGASLQQSSNTTGVKQRRGKRG
jgi:hypothetical protein